MKKHGAYWDSNDHVTVLYWMGEEVDLEDFNQRLMDQTKSAAKDLDWMLKGMELKDGLNEGEKTVAQLDEVEKIAKLPLCPDCRKLIGELPQ
jgi:hypothetical protein